jgi:hypothetical protein
MQACATSSCELPIRRVPDHRQARDGGIEIAMLEPD